ncbi:hypothetical protein CORC01_01110 [Colletotrichum orchidophilum]|uniref:Uncharacterized protein n=1 Tax=Colletotrichum orchidophilum TaxID=1209926 RepID=A0A1G4BQS0_9PEZI|nr:uncharacterized protein CORC01_01110 [Colletotrichum orchidophilum]OHF03791.1 hypothetical protein CORC01_01110 [Colletotrichum orchidophilum]
MLTSIFLTSLLAAGGAHAAPVENTWTIRANYSQCVNSTTLLQPVLEGATIGPSPSANVTDFWVPSKFTGSLYIKPAGAVGYGSPYQPQLVNITSTGLNELVQAFAFNGTGQPANVTSLSFQSPTGGGAMTIDPAEGGGLGLNLEPAEMLIVSYCDLLEAGGPVV